MVVLTLVLMKELLVLQHPEWALQLECPLLQPEREERERRVRERGGADYEERVIMGDLTAREAKDYYLRMTNNPVTEIEALIAKIYSDIISDRSDTTSLEEWNNRLKYDLNNLENANIRSLDIPRPFIDQIYHFLNLCGLEVREWSEVYHAVIFDNSIESRLLHEKMTYACRYIGFDPSVILRKLIRHHREGTRQPYLVFNHQFESRGEISEWTYSNHEAFMKDMSFLIITFLQRGAVISKIAKKSARVTLEF